MLKKNQKFISLMLSFLIFLTVNKTVLIAYSHDFPNNLSVQDDPFYYMYDSDTMMAERLDEIIVQSNIDGILNMESFRDSELKSEIAGNQSYFEYINDALLLGKSLEQIISRNKMIDEIKALPIDNKVLEIMVGLPDKYLDQAVSYQNEVYIDRFIIKYKSDSSSKLFHKTYDGISFSQDISIQEFSGVNLFDNSLFDSSISDMDYQKNTNQNAGLIEFITLSEKINPKVLADELRTSGASQYIEYIQPDYTLSHASLEVDNDTELITQTKLESIIESPLINKSNQAIVAIIDTGIDSSHYILADYMIDGWNFITQNSITYDPSYHLSSAHGTHIAGIIAKTAQETGSDIKIMPLQVFDNGKAYTSDILLAIQFALDNGVSVINCSFGSISENPALYDIMAGSDALFVCAAGNNRVDIDVSPTYPAAYRLPNVISVGSVNDDGGFSYFSNYSTNLVDIAAPGRDIISSLPNNAMGVMSGTSMSTAQISGTAAAAKAQFPEKTPSELRELLLYSSDNLANLQNKTSFGRRVNQSNALSETAGSFMQLNPEDDFDVHGYQPTQSEQWELFSSSRVVSADGGSRFSLALLDNGTVWAWGDNDSGQLGDGSYINSTHPVQVQGLTDVIAISAGYSYGLAVKSDGTVWLWGTSETSWKRTVPAQISGLYNIKSVETGYNYSLALDIYGKVWAWGSNKYGRLGNLDYEDCYYPVRSNVSDIVKIAAGENHSLALDKFGKVYAWGNNDYGKLGNGENVGSNSTPQSINIDSGVFIKDIAVGVNHSLALDSDGIVWAWGDNSQGQIGDGSMEQSSPAYIICDNDIELIGAGDYHSLALRRVTNSMWAWGSNSSYQLASCCDITYPYAGDYEIWLDSEPVFIKGSSKSSYFIDTKGELYIVGQMLVEYYDEDYLWYSMNGSLDQGNISNDTNDIEAVKILLQNKVKSPIPQSTANTVAAARAVLTDRINSLDLRGVTVTIQNESFTSAVDSKDGSYSFTFKLSKGRADNQFLQMTLKITADNAADGILSIFAAAESSCIVVLSVNGIDKFTDKIFKLKYDNAVLQLVDFAAQTQASDTVTGRVDGTCIEILFISNGEIQFKIVDTQIAAGKAWSGVITLIKFNPLKTSQTTVEFVIE